MTTQFGADGRVESLTLYSPPHLPMAELTKGLLPTGKEAERLVLFESGGLVIEARPNETPRAALERWREEST